MTLPHVYNATGAREAGIACRTCADDVFDLGLCKPKTPSGDVARDYDLERTLATLFTARGLWTASP